MKVMLVTYSMMAGGAERVAATLVNYWAERGHEVSLVTITSSASDFYHLQTRVERVGLDLGRPSYGWRQSLANNFRIIRRLRSVMRTIRPDVVLSFVDLVNLRVLLAAAGTGIPVVVEEHTDPTQYSAGRLAAGLRRVLYPRAGAVVVLTKDIAQWASAIAGPASVHVIPNPVGEQFRARQTDAPQQAGKVMAVGRLAPEKGFDLLIRAFAGCADAHPDWKLEILGEGPQRPHLEGLARELGIDEKVVLRGAVKDTHLALQQSDLFVLSSRFEGFPMALLEAMACGLPVIAFDCRSGPREMIQNGVNGVLVPPNDVNALTRAMSQLMGAAEERRRLGQRAVLVAEHFSLAKVDQMWRSLFDQVISRPLNAVATRVSV